MNWKHVASLALAAFGAGAVGLAQADPAHAAAWHLVAGAFATLSPYFALTSPKLGGAS